MKIIQVKLYRFDELSPEAQRRAFSAWDSSLTLESRSSDYRATLKAFEDIFDIKVYRYNVNDWSYDYGYVTTGRAMEAPEGDGFRFARYIWNNYYSAVAKGKYYSTGGRYEGGHYTYKFRRSKIQMRLDNCPLTGFFADQDILSPVIDCLQYKRFFADFRELIDACLAAFFQTWRTDIEATTTPEYFADEAEANEMYFLESGDIYYD